MKPDYLPYIVTELYCIVFTVTILHWLGKDRSPERGIPELKKMICAFLVMLVTDLIWPLDEGGYCNPPDILYVIINSVCNLSVGFGCYYWYCFVDRRLLPVHHDGRKDNLIRIPLIAVGVLYFLTVFTGCVISVDAGGHFTTGPLFWITCVIDYLYLMIPMGRCVIRAVRTKSKRDRREFVSYVLYMIVPLAVGFFEDSFPTVPILELNIFMVILLLLLTIHLDSIRQIAEKDRELTDSRVSIMLSQIQPHFLYNALAVIQDMCHGKAPEAEETTIEFAEFLRANMDSLKQREPIPFMRELQHTQNYLNLERKRFGGLLQVEYDIRATGFTVPALTLQPIVENAVRYGVMQREDGGTVFISSAETETEYTVTVKDNGVGFDIMAK